MYIPGLEGVPSATCRVLPRRGSQAKAEISATCTLRISTPVYITKFNIITQECNVKEEREKVRKGFTPEEGPFVRALDEALSSFNVQRQAYYGGMFVGNHVHRTLQVY